MHSRPPGTARTGFWTSRPVVAVGFLVGLILALGVPAAIAGMIYGTVQRPLTGTIASVAVLLTGYLSRRVLLVDPDIPCRRILYAGIAAGMVGEALTYWIFSLPPGAPSSAPWVALFVAGIGGAIGVLFAGAMLLLIAGLVVVAELPSLARLAFGRRDGPSPP